MRVSRELPAGRSSAVPLQVDHVAGGRTEGTSTIHCSDIEGTELRVVVQEPPATDLSLETGGWYRFDGIVRPDSLDAQLLFPSGDRSVKRIETPERQTPPPPAELDDPWLIQLGASDELIAVTVQPRPSDRAESIRVDDPGTFEIGAVCFAYCDRPGEATVYHREEPETRDEQLLLEHVVEDLSEAKGATLVTRGNDHAPLDMLFHRLARASGGDVVPTGAERVLDDCFHAIPESVATRTGADTLADVGDHPDTAANEIMLSDHDIGVDPVVWREDWEIDATALSDVSDPRMTDRDYATLVEWYLGAEDGPVDPARLASCLKAYASSDLDLLCAAVADGAMDRYGCPRLSGRLPKQ